MSHKLSGAVLPGLVLLAASLMAVALPIAPPAVAAGPAADAIAPSQAAATAASLPVFAPVTRHGHLVFASGVLATDLRATSDITAQATQVLDDLRRRLARANTSLARIASATVYLASAEDFAAMNTVWAQYFPSDPPARTTVIVPLPLPGARIQVSAVAAVGGARRTVILPKGWLKPSSPYSYAVRVDDTLFLSGLLSRRGTDNAVVPGDIAAQTRTVFDNAQAILSEAGFTLADVVSARVFITDVANFEAMNGVYRTFFPEAPPARATVKTDLTGPDYLTEITLLAEKFFPRTAVTTPNADGTPGRPNPDLSSAIGVGPRLFLSGMLGVVTGTAPDPVAQTGETLARLGRTLTAAGFGWQDVVDATVYVTDVSSAGAVVRAVQQKTGRRSAGTVVGSGLVSADGRVEIMLTAGK